MQLVIIESPFAASSKFTVEAHIDYARLCMKDSLLRGEAPYASHLLYTQEGILDDQIPAERDAGIRAGFAWKHLPNVLTVFYTDCGISSGMQLALDYCERHKLPYEIRSIHNDSSNPERASLLREGHYRQFATRFLQVR